MYTRRILAALGISAAALLGVAPAVGGADTSAGSEARYDDPSNTFSVIDGCGDGFPTDLHIRVAGGLVRISKVAECGRATERIDAPEDAPLAWRLCVSRSCGPWHHEDV